tara:strand:- start:1749 stop:2057 length:309 start_codon:yes stop_codon:yes gene_type:complete
MITETQFLESLNIVRLYNIQLLQEIESNSFLKKTPLQSVIDNIENNRNLWSTRLRNAIRMAEGYYGKKYIEELTPNEFRKMRNVGREVSDELIKYKLKHNLK